MVRFFSLPRNPHWVDSAYFLSARLQRVDRSHRLLYLLRCQRALCDSPPASMGLAQRVSGGSGLGIHIRRSGQRTYLGSSCMGDLVDLGLATDIHAYSLAALCLL